MSENRIDKIWNYYNAMRGYTAQNDLPVAMFLLSKTKSELKGIAKVNESKAYETMLAVADKYNMNNPYQNSKAFFSAYMSSDEEDEVDWEAALASMDPRENFYIPKVLVDEFTTHFKQDTKDVLIPEAEKFVPFLSGIISGHMECSFFVTTMNHTCKIFLEEIFKGYENVQIEFTSIYEYEFSARKFDLIMSVPAFGIRNRAEEECTFISREYEAIALENLLLHLNSEGELIIILPARITFAAGRIKDLREFVQSMYKIEEIDELPSGIFSTTAIKTYLFSITTGRTEDVMIKRYIGDTKNIKRDGINELIVDEDTFVMEEELHEIGDWNLDRIFTMMDDDWQKYQNSGIKKEELGNVAQVFRGKAVSKKDANGSIGVVNISNLREFDIDYDSLDHLEEEERKVSNYLLREGDLLIPARGTAIRTAVFHEQSYPCIASSNVIVIRPDEKFLNALYLKVFLDSPMGNKILGGKQQGTIVINISYKDLKTMEIPLQTIKEQNEIAEEYQKELNDYLSTIREAEDRWNKISSELQHRIL